MLLTLLQSQGEPPPPPPVTDIRGGYGETRKRKQRDFEREKRERDELREAITAAVTPLKATKAEVVTTTAEGEEGVAILTRKSKVAIPVPASFNAAEVVRMIAVALEAAGIEARRVESERARRQAQLAFKAELRERVRRMERRRREEWLLLLS